MNGEFKGNEISGNFLKSYLIKVKYDELITKYNLNGEDMDECISYFIRNFEQIIDIFKIYVKLIEVNNTKDITEFISVIDSCKSYKIDLEYTESENSLYLYVSDFLDDYIDMPFDITYLRAYSEIPTKTLVDEFSYNIFDDDTWDIINSVNFDLEDYDFIDDLTIKLEETYMYFDVEQIKINDDDENRIPKYGEYETNQRIKALLSEPYIESGVIIYSSEEIDSYIEAYNKNSNKMSELKIGFNKLHEVLAEDCIRCTDVKIVESSNKMIPEYIKTKYAVVGAYYTIAPIAKCSLRIEKEKIASICNSYFFCKLIDKIEEIKCLINKEEDGVLEVS